ncbi:MAG: T9SS type A sorting domain-containing protein [candidate division WOR-3 bacterium]
MDPVSHLMFGIYHIGAPPNGNFEVEEIIYDVSEFLKNPHLAMLWDSIPQIVYEKGNSVYYIQGLSGGIKGYKGKSRGVKSEIRNSKSETNSNSQIPNSPSPLSSPIKGEEILVDEILKQDEMLKQVRHDIVQNETLKRVQGDKRGMKDEILRLRYAQGQNDKLPDGIASPLAGLGARNDKGEKVARDDNNRIDMSDKSDRYKCPPESISGSDEMLKQPVNQVQGMVQNDKGNRDGALYIGKENVFERNFLYHIYNNTPDTIDARHNYWYPPEPESIEYYIYDYYDDPNLGVVIYEPIDRGITGGPQGDEMLKHIIVNFGSSPTNCLSITYNLLISQKIEISVYDACGRLVSKEQGMKEKGRYNFVVSNIASGVYFVKFDCSGIELKKKFILVR